MIFYFSSLLLFLGSLLFFLWAWRLYLSRIPMPIRVKHHKASKKRQKSGVLVLDRKTGRYRFIAD